MCELFRLGVLAELSGVGMVGGLCVLIEYCFEVQLRNSCTDTACYNDTPWPNRPAYFYHPVDPYPAGAAIYRYRHHGQYPACSR